MPTRPPSLASLPEAGVGLRTRALALVLALGVTATAQAITLLPPLADTPLEKRFGSLSLDGPHPAALGLAADPGTLAPRDDGTDAALPGATPPTDPWGMSPETAMPTFLGFPHRVWTDFGVLLARPLSLDARDWTRLALGTAAVGVTAQFDDQLRTTVQRHGSASARNFANRIRPLGTWGGLAAMGVLLGAGQVLGNADLAATGEDGLEASLFAGGILTPAIKEIAGRTRPYSAHDDESIRLLSGGQSFPSGEATEAFTLAAVVSAHTDSLILRGLAWGLAGLVGWERMELDAHWASDVLAGALIGTAVGKWVSKPRQAETGDRSALAVQPIVGPRVLGITATLSW